MNTAITVAWIVRSSSQRMSRNYALPRYPTHGFTNAISDSPTSLPLVHVTLQFNLFSPGSLMWLTVLANENYPPRNFWSV